MGRARPDGVVARRRVPRRRRARVRGPGRAAEARPGTEPVGGRRAAAPGREVVVEPLPRGRGVAPAWKSTGESGARPTPPRHRAGAASTARSLWHGVAPGPVADRPARDVVRLPPLARRGRQADVGRAVARQAQRLRQVERHGQRRAVGGHAVVEEHGHEPEPTRLAAVDGVPGGGRVGREVPGVPGRHGRRVRDADEVLAAVGEVPRRGRREAVGRGRGVDGAGAGRAQLHVVGGEPVRGRAVVGVELDDERAPQPGVAEAAARRAQRGRPVRVVGHDEGEAVAAPHGAPLVEREAEVEVAVHRAPPRRRGQLEREGGLEAARDGPAQVVPGGPAGVGPRRRQPQPARAPRGRGRVRVGVAVEEARARRVVGPAAQRVGRLDALRLRRRRLDGGQRAGRGAASSGPCARPASAAQALVSASPLRRRP